MCINKDVVRRILAAHYHPSGDDSGPSWLTFIGHAKDSLHSVDLFRYESVALGTHWVLVVMDQYAGGAHGVGLATAPLGPGTIFRRTDDDCCRSYQRKQLGELER